jgi:hypothetical protein
MNAKIAKGGLMNENISFASEHRNELFGSFCAEQKERYILNMQLLFFHSKKEHTSNFS